MTPQIPILFEDETILVINKPAGIVTNRSATTPSGTIQDWMESIYPQLFSNLNARYTAEQIAVFNERSGMAHRLDKDTSGVMLLAKDPQTLEELMAQFKKRKVEKGYVALVHGQMNPRVGDINLPLGRLRHKRQHFGVVVGGKMTETRYQVVEIITESKLDERGFNLVALVPKTGRTHQLRVILKHLGHPIVGDTYYLSKKAGKADQAWCPRQFLHAAMIKIKHGGKQMSFEAPLAADLSAALELAREAKS